MLATFSQAGLGDRDIDSSVLSTPTLTLTDLPTGVPHGAAGTVCSHLPTGWSIPTQLGGGGGLS